MLKKVCEPAYCMVQLCVWEMWPAYSAAWFMYRTSPRCGSRACDARPLTVDSECKSGGAEFCGVALWSGGVMRWYRCGLGVPRGVLGCGMFLLTVLVVKGSRADRGRTILTGEVSVYLAFEVMEIEDI